MKQLLLSLMLSVSIMAVMAQMPKAINYQAVARNAQGQALANQTIKVRLSITSSAAGTPTLYSETRSVTTNALGLFNVQIGSSGALSTTGSFSNINWVNNTGATKSLKVELDINNSGAFTDMGSQSLVTVPYAFAADQAVNAANVGGHPISGQAPNPGDILKWDGSSWIPGSAAKVYPIVQYIADKTYPGRNYSSYKLIGEATEVTLTAGQTFTMVLTASIGSTATIPHLVAASVLLRPADNAAIPIYHSHSVSLSSEKKQVIVTATLKADPNVANLNFIDGKIPPGTYKLGLGINNQSIYSLDQNGAITGFIVVQ